MSNDWFVSLFRASVLLMFSGSCVALLSRFYPLASPRWYRLAWGAVLLQGLVLFPFSLTIESPDWLASQPLFSARTSNSGQGHIQTKKPVLPVDAVNEVSDINSSDAKNLISGSLKGRSSHAVDKQTAQSDSSSLALAGATSTKPRHSRHVELATSPREAGLPEVHSRPLSAGVTSPAADRLLSAASNVRWTEWLAVVWACGTLGLVGFGLANYVILNISLLKARPARRSWAKELQELSLELNLDRCVALDVHPIVGPLICWTPAGHKIVVPVGLWSELSSDERIAVLHHELSHLRRGDLWKSLAARMILALHWFNPLAWISARRFDESAEWACDALMASEQPARVTQLANALLAATTARDGSPILALSATGGPLFQRIRRLVSGDHQGDTVMRRFVWGGLLCPLVCLGLFQLQFTEPLAAQTATSTGTADEATASTDESVGTPAATTSVDVSSEAAQSSAKLKEITDRIVVGDQENLKTFIELMKTPTGQIVMADRAALQAQNASSEQDEVSQWQQFVADHFKTTGEMLTVNADFQAECDAYVSAVNDAETDVNLIGPVLKETAESLDVSTEPAQILQRFLNHEGAPAFVYINELRSRLHPRIEDLSEVFSELLVRNKDDRFVIRPARRSAVEDQLKNIERFQPMLKRFEEELAAWSKDLANPDERHGNLKAMLADPKVAVFLASRNLTEDDEPNDEHFDDYFYMLEEATNDAPAGLILNPESEQLNEIEAELTRFNAIQQERSVLERPLKELVDRLDESDDLHVRFKKYLSTDLALMVVVREMDYSPITADDAAREWLGQIVTKGDDSRYTITSESPEDLKSQCEDFFREFRDVRRRGRTIDEFASKLADKKLTSAMQTLTGKLILDDLVERSARRPDVDGMQLWFDAHFEEAAEGLKLFNWAGDEINGILEEAADLEEQLSKTDF
jgi:beta-lactamase regulating signal transducer with metallopeptidase domain